MNKENDWDHVTAASTIQEPIKNVTCEEMATAPINSRLNVVVAVPDPVWVGSK